MVKKYNDGTKFYIECEEPLKQHVGKRKYEIPAYMFVGVIKVVKLMNILLVSYRLS